MSNGQAQQFLSALLSSFGELGSRNPTGRNLAYCYAHALMAYPILAKDIFGREFVARDGFKLGKWNVKADKFSFKGPIIGKRRRADLCVQYNGKPLAVAEIKVEDQNEDDPTGQLKDNVAFAKQIKVPFYYITKYSLSQKELEFLKDAKKYARRHYKIAAALKKRKDNEIAQMIAGYLKDQKMSGYSRGHRPGAALLHRHQPRVSAARS